MSPRPYDFDPAEEQEIYDIFGTLRREVYDAIKDLATQIFARIDREQGEDARAEQPDLIGIIEHSLINLLQVIIRMFKNTEPPTQLPKKEEEGEEEAPPPIIRRRKRSPEDE